METDGLPTPDNAIFGEIQLLLAEKRTALASLRTGIAVFALPLSRVVSVRSFPGAELLEARIFAQRVPEGIDLKIAAGFAIGHFE